MSRLEGRKVWGHSTAVVLWLEPPLCETYWLGDRKSIWSVKFFCLSNPQRCYFEGLWGTQPNLEYCPDKPFKQKTKVV